MHTQNRFYLDSTSLVNTNADYTNMNMGNVNFSNANLSFADLSGVNLSKTVWVDGTVCATGSASVCSQP